jgi:hypothetical protein
MIFILVFSSLLALSVNYYPRQFFLSLAYYQQIILICQICRRLYYIYVLVVNIKTAANSQRRPFFALKTPTLDPISRQGRKLVIIVLDKCKHIYEYLEIGGQM